MQQAESHAAAPSGASEDTGPRSGRTVVVTGQRPDGTSVFVAERRPLTLVGSGFPTQQNTALASSAGPVTLPSDGTTVQPPTFFPPPGGYRYFVLTIDPDSSIDPNAPPMTGDQFAELDGLFPGLLAAMEPDEPGMHRSNTVDFGMVLSGAVVLELDDGAERTLHSGDAFVQNGTRHRWRNPGPVPTTLAVMMMGAVRSSGPAAG